MLPTFRPNTRSELAAALDFIHQSLEEMGIPHVEEQDDENPDVWSVAALDSTDHANAGLVAWNKNTNQIEFLAHDPVRENHDLAEGIPEEESRCWWSAESAENMVLHLNGSAREIMDKLRRLENTRSSTASGSASTT